MKIENFKTGVPIDPNVKPIDLDPKDNINNKKHVRRLLKNIVESSPNTLQENLNNAYHKDAKLKCFYPVNEIQGIDEIQDKLFALKIYKSQINKKTPSRSPDSVKALANFRGSQNGCKYAEAFKVARIVI